MLAEIRSLLVVQDRDQKIARLKAELKRLPAEEEHAQRRLHDDRAAVTAAQSAVQQNEIAMKNLELDIETRRTTIGRLKTQQFETRKNDEYRALGHEIERYEKEVTSLEDRELELMEKGEDLKAALKDAETKLAATSSRVDDDLRNFGDRRTACEAQIAEVEADRAKAAADIDESLLGQYQRIFVNKRDAAVVPINHAICGGCHMKVTTSTLHKARAENEVTFCENCGRIVYAGEE